MKDIIIGVDAGTSVIKSIAFDLDGEQLAVSSVANVYSSLSNSGVEQDMEDTWSNTLKTLRGLVEQIDQLPERLAAISVTGQGDGTWLIDDAGKPTAPAWLWLDGRAGELANELSQSESESTRFNFTGTGLNACQQGSQLAWMKRHQAELLEKSHTAFHCKDWLYYKLTGERVTDPSEGCFTFGDFRTREYSDDVLRCLGLIDQQSLLPPMLEGVDEHHALTGDAANHTGLLPGTPVVLGYVDIICTALGAGLYDPVQDTGCTIVGSTGVHMGMTRRLSDVSLNSDRTGYTMPMPIPGVSAQIQTNMASTLNIDWLLDLAVNLIASFQAEVDRKDLIARIDQWMADTQPSALLYQPYISEAGERGPFIDSKARASFLGLSTQHGFAELVRSVIEGLAFAARDCYEAMGGAPAEVRLTGGAARSEALRRVFGSVLGTSLRTTQRQEAGAAGAAMIAAVNIGHFATMDDCVTQWVHPLLGPSEAYDESLHAIYQQSFQHYVQARKALAPLWQQQAALNIPI
ncbi:MAG: carbohydrate kinase [Granulosicoccus sp.]|nr:carbohydrate kinase [Granulosicoccus sp.]